MKSEIMKISIQEEAGEKGFAMFKRPLNEDYPLHFHDFFEFEHILSGSGTTYINSIPYPLKKGSTIFVTPLDFQSITVNEPITLITVNFASDWIDKMLAPFCESATVRNDIPYNYFELLFHEYTNGFNENFTIKNLLNCIVAKTTSHKPALSQEKSINISNMISHYIRMHYNEKINLEVLSKEFGYTPNYLSHLFHKTLNKTIKEYILNVRLSSSVKMLMSTDASVTDICFNCGFESLITFLRVFKAKYNMTPKEYRKLYKSISNGKDIVNE